MRGSGRGKRGAFEGRRMSVAPDLLFQARFGSLEDAGGEIHGAFPMLISIDYVPAEPKFLRQQASIGIRYGGACLAIRSEVHREH